VEISEIAVLCFVVYSLNCLFLLLFGFSLFLTLFGNGGKSEFPQLSINLRLGVEGSTSRSAVGP